jgi:geranylgeranyl reductase family protein
MSPVLDALVVGAGPAGSGAAAAIAAAGGSVVLLEKQAFPRSKTCGGGLVWRGRQRLPANFRLPVQSECRSARLCWRSASSGVRVEREWPIVTMTLRSELDEALARHAVSAGATLLEQSPLLGLERDGNLWKARIAKETLRARTVIAADGATGVTARMAGWRDTLACIPALEAELERGTHVTEEALFDFADVDQGYAWCFPKREQLSVGILSMQRGTKGLRESLDRWLVRRGLSQLAVREVAGYIIPVRPRAVLARNGCLLAGDAAGLVDPLTAEGISLALTSGEAAGRAALSPEPEQAYRHELERDVLPELRAARFLAGLVYRRRALADWVLRRGEQAACEAMVAVISGERGYRDFLRSPKVWAKLLLR